MGGAGAPDDIGQAHLTQAWLATSQDAEAMVSGQYFYHKRPRAPNPHARDERKQQALLSECARVSGFTLK
jgi:hypothetical protein